MGDISPFQKSNNTTQASVTNYSATPTFDSPEARNMLSALSGQVLDAPTISGEASNVATAIRNQTAQELPVLLAQARSRGHGRSNDWTTQQMGAEVGRALADRDSELARIQLAALGTDATNLLASRDQGLNLLSLLRGETGTDVTDARGKTAETKDHINLWGALGGLFGG